MSPSTAVIEILMTMPDVVSLVTAAASGSPTRIYNVRYPQSFDRPAIRVQQIDQIEGGQLRGTSSDLHARVQVDMVARTLAECDALRDAVHGDGAGSGLAFWSGRVGSPPFIVDVIKPALERADEFIAEEFNDYRKSLDVIVQHR